MHSLPRLLFAGFVLYVQARSLLFNDSATIINRSVTAQWLEKRPLHNHGTTFGVPWPRGQYFANETLFTLSGDGGSQIPSGSWITGYWSDGSIKWTAHAISAGVLDESFAVNALPKSSPVANQSSPLTGLTVKEDSDTISVNTGKLTVTFPKAGNVLVKEIKTSSGQTVGQSGRLVLRSQSSVFENEDVQGQPAPNYHNFKSSIDNVTVTKGDFTRALVTIRGDHPQVQVGNSTTQTHKDWLPFVTRFYLYAESDSVRVVHSLIYDGEPENDFVRGIGIRFDVPLDDELYDRHIRIAGVDGGILNEAVQGITGLRRDPGEAVRAAQYQGEKTPPVDT